MILSPTTPARAARGLLRTITVDDVRAAISEALERSAVEQAATIHIELDGSRITLRGTVRSAAERDDAARAAWRLPGVERVDCDLEIERESTLDSEC